MLRGAEEASAPAQGSDHLQRSVALATLLVVSGLVLPTGLATWRAYGTFEPDSTWDNSDFMQQNPPAPGEKKLYFNAYPGVYANGANPNVGALSMRNQAAGAEHWFAMLGRWVDCNGDGYVGLAESAANEYKSEILTLPGAVNHCDASTALGKEHNKNGWVVELMAIGPNVGGNQTLNNSRMIYDDTAMVWGDEGVPVPLVPDQAPPQGNNCALRPFPRGTTQSTGGFLNYVECFSGYTVLETATLVQQGGTVRGIPVSGADPGNDLGLNYEDRNDWNEAGHPLNVGTLGDDGAENSMVTVYDCRAPTTWNSSVAPIVNPSVDGALGATPAAPYWGNAKDGLDPGVRPTSVTTNPQGTLAGTNNETQEEMFGDCDTTNDAGGDTYALEGDHDSTTTIYKKETGFAFSFENVQRGREGRALVSRDLPPAAGLTPLHALLVAPYWDSSLVTILAPSTVRADLRGDIPDVQPSNATFSTFYAKIGQAGLAAGRTPSASTGTYGNLFCPSFGAGAGTHHGWECDGSKWWTNAVDGSAQTLTFHHARPGDTYQFRDVDCFDGSVADLPAGASPARIAALTCDSAPQAPNPN